MSGPSRDAGGPGAGAGCPGWQGPASVMGRRISGSWAGCPAARDGPDVRAWGPNVRADLVQLRVSSVMGAGFPRVGPDVRAGSGCPGWGWMSGAWSSLLPFSMHQLVHELGDLSIFTPISDVVFFTPEHTKHAHLR